MSALRFSELAAASLDGIAHVHVSLVVCRAAAERPARRQVVLIVAYAVEHP